jgi:hypothetical protein
VRPVFIERPRVRSSARCGCPAGRRRRRDREPARRPARGQPAQAAMTPARASGRGLAARGLGSPRRPPASSPSWSSAPYRVRPDLAASATCRPRRRPRPPTLLRLDDGAPRALAALLASSRRRRTRPLGRPGVASGALVGDRAGRARGLGGRGRPAGGARRRRARSDLPWLGLRDSGSARRDERSARSIRAPRRAGRARARGGRRPGAPAARRPPARRPAPRGRRGPGGAAARAPRRRRPRRLPAGGRRQRLGPGRARRRGLRRSPPARCRTPRPCWRPRPAWPTPWWSAGPFVRYVWSLAADDALSHHPRRHPARPLDARPPATWWYRAERQTTLPLPEAGASLFAIRVLHAPLAAVATTPARRAALAAAVASMDAALLAYKGLTRGGAGAARLAALSRPARRWRTPTPIATTSSVSRS